MLNFEAVTDENGFFDMEAFERSDDREKAYLAYELHDIIAWAREDVEGVIRLLYDEGDFEEGLNYLEEVLSLLTPGTEDPEEEFFDE